MSTPNEPELVLLQNDGSNFLSWSIHVLNAFRDISPLIDPNVDASIPLAIVDWGATTKICQKRKRYACNSMLKQLISF